MSYYIDSIECIDTGTHLTQCDDDGYCVACGCQPENEDFEPIAVDVEEEV
jgi:hypothetical protein